uniref:Uncharacterized protein n=1 Tax=Cacopsylla melanoneura TaxID=428564 RepID=A0A8D8QWG5_9HEMI
MLGSNVRNVALWFGVVVVSFVLISSYDLSDSDYRDKLADIKSPQHVRVDRPDSCSYSVSSMSGTNTISDVPSEKFPGYIKFTTETFPILAKGKYSGYFFLSTILC